MGMLGASLDRAVQGAFTRPIPKTAPAQMRYLVKQLRITRAVAQLLGISQRTVQRYVKDQIKRPRPDLAARLEREVTHRWQPHVRARCPALRGPGCWRRRAAAARDRRRGPAGHLLP